MMRTTAPSRIAVQAHSPERTTHTHTQAIMLGLKNKKESGRYSSDLYPHTLTPPYPLESPLQEATSDPDIAENIAAVDAVNDFLERSQVMVDVSGDVGSDDFLERSQAEVARSSGSDKWSSPRWSKDGGS